MKETWTYRTEVRLFYIETKERTKKSNKPIRRPVIQRSLYVTCTEGAGSQPRRYRIFQVRRNKQITYSVTCIRVQEQSHWTNPDGVCKPWHKEVNKYKDVVRPDGETEIVLNWKEFCKSMEEPGIVEWLRQRFGGRAELIFADYLTAAPEKMAA